MFRRLLSIGGLAGLFTVTLAATVAAGGGGFGAPGNYHFTDSSAYANLEDGAQTTYVNLYVDHGALAFRVKGQSGPRIVQQFGTVLNLFAVTQTPAGPSFAFGCWIISDSDFSVAPSLSSASLNADPSSETPCPGFLVSAASGGRPGLETAIPDGKGGGGGGGPLPSVTVHLTWTSNGAVFDNRGTNNADCQTFHSTSQGSFANAFSTASGTVSVATGTLSDPVAAIGQSDFTQVINGTLTPACGGF